MSDNESDDTRCVMLVCDIPLLVCTLSACNTCGMYPAKQQ